MTFVGTAAVELVVCQISIDEYLWSKSPEKPRDPENFSRQTKIDGPPVDQQAFLAAGGSTCLTA